MSRISHHEVLTTAAGIKIVTPLLEDADSFPSGKIVLKMRKIDAVSDVHDKSCGFHLTKSKWDPYPWIGYVEKNSFADLAGLRTGDCLLGVDDIDLLGLKIKDIAALIRSEKSARDLNFSIWRYPRQKEEHDIGLALKGPLPDVAKNLANALSGTVRALECPICLESAAPPVSQCVQGHILCVICRPKTSRCPICRVRLGQGRCLLADKLHTVLRDIFNVNDEMLNKTSVAFEHCNLRDQLFGKNNTKQETVLNRLKNNCANTLKPRQFLLTRLLLGNREKAVSADNLIRVSEISKEAAVIPNEITNSNSLRLSLNDRTKSASTGELSRSNEVHINDPSSRIGELSINNTSRQSLSLPQTPIWSGSTDSMFCVQLTCPLYLQSCKELVTADSLLEHIKTHALPQIHFYSGSAKIPLPLPFGHDAFYIFHHGSNIFFFQCREETAWMAYPVKMAGYATSNTWEWTLHAYGDNGTEIQLRRQVVSLEDPLTLSSQHIAPLPTALLLKTVNIQISEQRAHDRLYV